MQNQMMTRRPGVIAAMMVLAAAGAGARALAADPIERGAAARDGTLSLVLENAVPFAPQRQEHGRRNYDCEIDLEVRDGKVMPRGWAWIAAMPGAEHEVSVSRGDLTAAGDLTLEMTVAVRDALPAATGGSATLHVRGSVSEGRFEGSYKAAFQAPDDKARLTLWTKLGGQPPVAFRGGLRSGNTESIAHLARRKATDEPQRPIAATGVMKPPRASGAVSDAGELTLWGRAGLKAISQKAGPGAEMHAQLTKLAGARASGAAVAGDTRTCDGFAAAAWAVLAKCGDATAGEKSVEAARKSLTARGDDNAMAREVSGLAMALDAAGAAWPEDLRKGVREHLLVQARRFCGMTEAEKSTDVALRSKAGDVEGPWDTGLAARRAGAGLAALAVLRDAAGPQRDDADAALQVAARSVRRFLERGVGSRGAGTGSNGFDEAIELVAPFVAAYRASGRGDLATGTGGEWIGIHAMYARGLAMNPPAPFDRGFWLPVGAALAGETQRPAIAWYWQQRGFEPACAFHAALAMAVLPDFSKAAPPKLPLTLVDSKVESYVARSGWDDARDFVTIFEMGAGAPEAAAMRGHWSVYGLGREWIRRTPATPGIFSWPSTRQSNLLQVLASETTTRGEVTHMGGGHMANLRARRDGAASISMVTGGFFGAVGLNKDDDIESKSWRTIGIDYSKASGAPALFTIVEGTYGLEDRHQVWEIDLGATPAALVKSGGLSFSVGAEGTPATMTGTVLYPTTAYIEYVPPTDERPRGRLRVHRQKPGENSLQAMWKKLDDKLDTQIKAMLADEVSNIDVEKFDLKLDETNTAEADRLQRQNEILYLKLLKETSSVKMGAPDRRPRAKGNWVIVLTIQESKPPAVKVLDTSDEALFTVGAGGGAMGQKVTYREYLVEYAK